jgi:translocation and assembly module TamB
MSDAIALKRHRRTAITAGLAVAVLVAGLALLWWLSSASFDRFLADRLGRGLARFNLRVESDSLNFRLSRMEITVTGLRLFPGQESKPLLTVGRLRAKFRLRDIWDRNYFPRELEIKYPQLAFSFDDQGRSNLDELNLDSIRKEREPETLAVTIGRIVVTNGSIAVNHRKYEASLFARDVNLSVVPASPQLRVEAEARNCDLKIGNSPWQHTLKFEFASTVDKSAAKIERLHLVSEAADVLATGSVSDWGRPKYDLTLAATANLSKLAVPGTSDVDISGGLTFRGRVYGEGNDYKAEGVANSRDLMVWGIRLAGVQSSLGGRGQGSFSSSLRTTAGLVAASLFRARRLDLKTNLSWGDSLFSFTGGVQLADGTMGPVPFEDFRGSVRAGPDEIRIEEFTANSFGGSVKGSATINLNGPSQATMSVQGMSLSQIAAGILSREPPLTGIVGGAVSVRWPSVELRRMTAQLGVKIESGQADIGGQLPTSGDVDATFDSWGIKIQASKLAVGKSIAKLTGAVAWKGDVALDFDVTSDDLTEHEMVLATLGYKVSELTRGIVPKLEGVGSYRGTLKTEAEQLRVTATVEARGFLAASERVKSFSSRVEFNEGDLRLENAKVQWETGETANVAVGYTIGENNGLSVAGRLDRVNLGRWLAALGQNPEGVPLTGLVTGRIDFSGLPSSVRGSADVVVSDGEIKWLARGGKFQRLSATVRVNQSRYELERVAVKMDYGEASLAGWVDRSTREYKLKAEGMELQLAQLTQMVQWRELELAGRLSFAFEGDGKFTEPRLAGTLGATDITVSGKPVGRIDAELGTEGERIKFKIAPAFFGHTQPIEGVADFGDDARPLQAETHLDKFDLTPYLTTFARLKEVSGSLSGDVRLEWSLADTKELSVKAVIPEMNLRREDYALRSQRPFGIEISRGRIKIEPIALEGENTNLEFGGTLDLASLWGRQPESAANDLSFNGRLDLRFLRTFYPSLFTTGLATIRAAVRGSFAEPRLSGIMDIEDATLRILDVPLSLTKGKGRIRFTADQALIETLRADTNGGELNMSGGLVLKNFKADRWRLAMRAEGVQLSYPAGFRSLVDGDLVLQGSRQLQVLSGTITARRSEYLQDVDLAGLILPSGGSQQRSSRIGIVSKPPMSLDVRVQALDTISVKNNLADAVGSVWMHIGGSLDNPIISGTATVTRGTIRFRSRDYQFTRGRIDFPKEIAAGFKPRFNLETETDIRGYRVIVGFVGTLDKFQTTLRSEPALPVDDIVSLITAGDINRSVGDTPAVGRAGAGNAASIILGELSQRAGEFTGKLFGINRFQVDPLLVGRGSDPTARVTVGRQVNRNFSILYSSNISGPQEQVIIVEYRLSDRFSLVGVRDQDGNFSFDLRVRKRF